MALRRPSAPHPGPVGAHQMRLPALDRRQAVSASLLSLGVAPLSHWSAAAAASEAWPLIGLGTCCEEPAAAAAQVTSAVEAGFRLVDTAAHYPGESGVGDALSALEARGVVRPGEVQICSKVWFDDMGYEPALASAMRSQWIHPFLRRVHDTLVDFCRLHGLKGSSWPSQLVSPVNFQSASVDWEQHSVT